MGSSVAEFRAKLTPQIVSVTIPGLDLTIDCRQPDLVILATTGFMDWPALQAVQQLRAELAPNTEAVEDNRPVPTAIDKARAFVVFLNEYCCAAAMSPRLVMTPADAGADALCVDEIPFNGRLQILNATTPTKTPPAVADFRGQESTGDAPGPGSQAVRDETIDALVGAE